MSFNANIPLVTDYTVISQAQIRANFQAINKVFSRNHISLVNENQEQQGQHSVVTLRQQTGDPTTAADQVSLYSKAVGTTTMLFYRPQSDQTAIQLTYPSISTGLQSKDPAVYLSHQYSYVAGPFVVYVGMQNVADNTPIIFTPATTLLYVGLTVLTPAFPEIGGSINAAATNITGNQFTVRFTVHPTTPSTNTIYYLAIGM